jgi:NAD(P)-dependent dehydrogenase (short-subunit alcohol dehydrogenase family)
MTQRFAHQSVIVTGAGSGIGLATASGFAQEGASVMVADLRARRAQAAGDGYPWSTPAPWVMMPHICPRWRIMG